MHRPHALSPLLSRHTAIGTFAGPSALVAALKALVAAGVDVRATSVLTRDETGAAAALVGVPGGEAVGLASPVTLSQAVEHSGAEEATGAVVGGGLGLLVGLTALAVPGFGSALLASGPVAVVLEALLAATAGAGLGTLIGSILDDRGSAELCEEFEAALSRGAWLIVVQGDEPTTGRAAHVMAAAGAERVERV